MNLFIYDSVAQRYARGRPAFHDLVVAKIRDALDVQELLPRALDIGCGTGMSARALRSIAGRVDGIDCSKAMLAAAVATEGVHFHLGAAENLPFPDDAFYLATVASAFHWFDRERFLSELARVLRAGGHFVIYENAFPGRMIGCPNFADWQRSFYERFPRTPRDSRPLTDDEAAAFGLRFVAREEYTNQIDFTPRELSLYLSTQSNAVEAIERGALTAANLREMIEDEVAAFFGEREQALFEFCGYIWVFQKDTNLTSHH